MNELLPVFSVIAQFSLVAVAVWSVGAVRRIARQRATLDFIMEYNNDGRVSQGHQTIRRYKDEPLDEYLKQGSENLDNFLFVMNMFEILAIGLKRGIYDENMAVDMFGEDLRHIYESAKPMTIYIRKTGGEAFRHWEELAARVENRPGISRKT